MLTTVIRGKSTTCVEKHGKRCEKAVSKWEKLRHFPISCPLKVGKARFPTHLFPSPPVLRPLLTHGIRDLSCSLCSLAASLRSLCFLMFNVFSVSVFIGVHLWLTLFSGSFLGFMGSLFEFFKLLLTRPPCTNDRREHRNTPFTGIKHRRQKSRFSTTSIFYNGLVPKNLHPPSSEASSESILQSPAFS